ncbi:C40 family peptidase [Gilliamella sp. Pra-s60]|uniref:C40 family peptidase n=1 Tax=unclassified Gilliamella TaxID=2685620 RepID=UPI0019237C0B|nr:MULTISPECIES: C40 family peptidase [unclassified Gilliamella]
MKTQILNHAKQCGEAECCGFVIDNKIYLPCKNISPTPTETFQISPDDWIKTEESGVITAIVHSHPDGLPILSEADQFYQQKTAVDWWLVCDNKIHKFRYMQPLLGREFKHGVTDCYALFRDAYHLCGFDFPNFHRDDGWWDNGQNLYLDNMQANGFHQVSISSLQDGDVILFPLNSKTVNHAAIYIGNNFILHHLPRRLSKRDLFSGYWLKNYHSIWRHKQWQSLNFTAILSNMAINTK